MSLFAVTYFNSLKCQMNMIAHRDVCRAVAIVQIYFCFFPECTTSCELYWLRTTLC